ncbi:hypothetical protein EDB85DRAFT_2145712 [Lactarius pseudohatsudake]|nr:hypothetical protein EDB85DRAFT_2145712 [Lactarius pseudohatsudake]
MTSTLTMTSSRVETLDAVVNKNGTIITSSVLGKVNVNCKLRCGFPGPHASAGSRHGRFTLMEYRFDPSASKPGAAPALTAAAAAQLQVHVPFTLGTSLSITDHGGAFELSFTPRAGALEDVAVELYLGSSATGATSSGGGWTYVPTRRWSRPLRLRDPLYHPFKFPLRARPDCDAAALVRELGRAPATRACGADLLELSGETYTPYKGVRGRALGRVEWRVEWNGG